MAMMKGVAAASPDAYVEALSGKRLAHLDPRLQLSGKFELANLILTEATGIDPLVIERLAAEAFRLNSECGDPTARHA